MIINPFFIADATSEVEARLNNAIKAAEGRVGAARRNQLRAVQKKIEELRSRGLLNRQEFGTSTSADFSKLFLKKSV